MPGLICFKPQRVETMIRERPLIGRAAPGDVRVAAPGSIPYKGGVIAAIDLGRHCAFAAAKPGQKPLWLHVDLGPGSPGMIYAKLARQLDAWLTNFNPEILASETPYVPWARFKKPSKDEPGFFDGQPRKKRIPFNHATVLELDGMYAVAQLAAYARGVHFLPVGILEVSGSFTGVRRWSGGRDEKKAQTARMCELYGWPRLTQDEADAAAVFCYVEAMLAPAAAQQRGVGPLFIRRAGK